MLSLCGGRLGVAQSFSCQLLVRLTWTELEFDKIILLIQEFLFVGILTKQPSAQFRDFFSRPTKRPTDRPSKEMANNVLFVLVFDKMGRHSSLTLKLRIHHQYPICFLPVPSIKKSKVRVGVPNYSVIKSFRKWYFKGSEWLSKNVA